MERKPLPTTATTSEAPAVPPKDVLGWEEHATTKKSLFSKPNFFGSSEKPSKNVSLESGRDKVGSSKEISRPSGSFFARNRKKVLIFGGIGTLLLILILGLGLGLGLKKSKKRQNLPFPGSTKIYNGDLTYYSPGPGYGACGYENTPHDKICAVSHIVFDAVSTSSNPNLNPLCGKKIRITRFDPAKGRNNSVDVEVVDRCTGCQPEDLDLSIDMFTSLAEEGQGRVAGSWAWLN